MLGSEFETLFIDNRPFDLSYLYTKTLESDMSSPASPIIPGMLYSFRYRAINIHGQGLWSAET
jgi:hypothetical protein